MSEETYRCTTCNSDTIVITPTSVAWTMACANGHPFVPVPGTVIMVTAPMVVKTL